MSRRKMIIIGNDDTIEVVNYKDFHSIMDAVGGMFQLIAHDYKGDDGPTLNVYCNDNFLNETDPAFKKVNAVAKHIYHSPIYSNLAVIVSMPYDFEADTNERGLTAKEVPIVEEHFKKLLADMDAAGYHKQYDRK